jgi:hypothetical protein
MTREVLRQHDDMECTNNTNRSNDSEHGDFLKANRSVTVTRENSNGLFEGQQKSHMGAQ